MRKSLRNDDQLLASFTSYLVKELGRSPRTALTYTTAIKRASATIGKPPHKIGADDLRNVLRSGNFAASTKRGMVVAFHQLHDYGVMSGRWLPNGLGALKTPKVARNPLSPMDPHDSLKILAASNSPILVRAVYLGLFAGLRISESAGVNLTTWRRGWLTIMGKGNKMRRVPVHPELERVKEVIMFRQPSLRTLESTFSRFSGRHGFTDRDGKRVSSHTLRRTAATSMYEAGAPWEVVGKVLGHGSDVTALYAQIPDERLVHAINLIDYHRGEPMQLGLLGDAPIACKDMPMPEQHSQLHGCGLREPST